MEEERKTSMESNDELSPNELMGRQSANGVSWHLLALTLRRSVLFGFGIGVSGGRDNPHLITRDQSVIADPSIVVTDVLPNGPANGLIQVGDRIAFVNGITFENVNYATAIGVMRESEQLDMVCLASVPIELSLLFPIIKRRAPLPFVEFEQRTLKFTLSKSKKKDDFGIVLGCRFYIKEITNPRLAEKEPGLREGDQVLRVNGSALDGMSLDEAMNLLHRSRERLSLVVQRDVRRGTAGSRWPSQTTVYERLGSVSGTPRHSPTPLSYSQTSAVPAFDYSPGAKRFSDPSVRSEYSALPSSPFPNGTVRTTGPRAASQTPSSSRGMSSPHLGHRIPQQSPAAQRIQTVSFKKTSSSLGIRVIGGNHVGIFVSAVAADSIAAKNQIFVGDRLHEVNGRSMSGLTREEAVEHLLAIGDDVTIRFERSAAEFAHIRNQSLGDSFYVRTHFPHSPSQRRTARLERMELGFQPGDIFHVTDTLFSGAVGYWLVTKVYAANGAEIRSGEAVGIIPNLRTAETMAKQSRMESSTLSRTLFRKKLQSRRTKSLTTNVEDDFLNGVNGNAYDLPLPAYERVVLRLPPFKRPVVLFGPLADVGRQLLLSNFALHFDTVEEENIIRLGAVNRIIGANKHCILNVSPCSVERLILSQYAPIVILIDVESRSRIRELRSRAGAPTASTRRLIEQSAKLKKYHSHLLTATLDAMKEDGWFEALRMLIAHLQERRVWIPENSPPNIGDLLLFPMVNADSESDKDYGVYDATSRGSDDLKSPPERSSFASAFARSAYGHQQNGYFDVKQIIAENFPINSETPNGTNEKGAFGTSDAPFIDESKNGSEMENIRRTLDWNGGILEDGFGLKLIIPPSAIPLGAQKEISLGICRNVETPSVIFFGPRGLHFNVPIELRLPNSWNPDSFILKSGNAESSEIIEPDNSPIKNPKDNCISVLISNF